MTREHIVRPGECLSSIASAYGFTSYEALYRADENAALRRLRRNPNLVCPGDKVVIPEPSQGKGVSVATGRSHRFVVRGEKTQLRMVLKDSGGRPFADMPYRLQVGGLVREGKTNGAGLLEEAVPVAAQRGTLTIWTGGKQEGRGLEIPLEIGHLDPHDTISGAQSRLNNLGYRCGQADGVIGPRTRAALSSFQERNGLSISGEADAATMDKLRQLHEEHGGSA